MTGWHSDEQEDVNYGPTILSYNINPVDPEREDRLSRLSKRFAFNISEIISEYIFISMDTHINKKAMLQTKIKSKTICYHIISFRIILKHQKLVDDFDVYMYEFLMFQNNSKRNLFFSLSLKYNLANKKTA